MVSFRHGNVYYFIIIYAFGPQVVFSALSKISKHLKCDSSNLSQLHGLKNELI